MKKYPIAKFKLTALLFVFPLTLFKNWSCEWRRERQQREWERLLAVQRVGARQLVAAGGATLDLAGSWRAADRTVLLAASGVLGVRVACEAPMMAAEGVRAARERRRTCERALARAEQAAPEAAAALYALDGVDASARRRAGAGR